MSDLPERVWITGYDSDPTSRWWSETPVSSGRAEYVRADIVQAQIDAAREGVLQEAALAVKECLFDENLPLSPHGIELNAVVYECHSAILALIRKGDQP